MKIMAALFLLMCAAPALASVTEHRHHVGVFNGITDSKGEV